MKSSDQFRYGIGALLCVTPVLWGTSVACATDENAPPATAPPIAASRPDPMTILLRDSDELRAIEVQSDRKESIEEFFARQKLSLVGKPNTDGHFWSVGETIRDAPLKFFASYPLDNDRDFAPYRFGAFYELAPTSPTISALFQHSPTPLNWNNTLLIVAPSGDQSDAAVPVAARVVGRIFIKEPDKWAPYNEAQKLKYRGDNTE